MNQSTGSVVWTGLTVLLFTLASTTQAESLSSVAQRIGAQTFYDFGYTGSGALIGNVESGWTWDVHEALDAGQVIQQDNLFATSGVEGHATAVGGTMVAEEITNGGPGISYGSTLWTGKISTEELGGGSFRITGNSLLYPLMTFGEVGINDAGEVGGVGARTVDVINSSWGAADDTGNTIINVIYDYLANSAGVTMVVSAGNSGQGEGNVGTPANGWNVIAVGATGGTSGDESVTSWSSGGPSGSFNLPGTRTKPDIVAPGLDIWLPTYFPSDLDIFWPASGTSFSSPIVAASAGLLIDYAKDTGRSTDPRLVKSILMNSATKLDGWNQEWDVHPTTGTVINYTPVDDAQGTGRINLTKAYAQYAASTDDDTAPGAVGTAGWDLSTVSQDSPSDYFVDTMLPAGSTLAATLIWFMDRSVKDFDYTSTDPFATTKFANDSFDDLDLTLYTTDAYGGVMGNAVAASISGWDPTDPNATATGLDSVEHLYLDLPADGRYLLRVDWVRELFDSTTNPDVNAELFALSWSIDALTPGDGNADGLVDGADLGIWQQNYDPLGLNVNTFAMGDWNFDGRVDGADLALWQQNYLPISSPLMTPEPASLMLLTMGGLVLVVRKRSVPTVHASRQIVFKSP